DRDVQYASGPVHAGAADSCSPGGGPVVERWIPGNRPDRTLDTGIHVHNGLNGLLLVEPRGFGVARIGDDVGYLSRADRPQLHITSQRPGDRGDEHLAIGA